MVKEPSDMHGVTAVQGMYSLEVALVRFRTEGHKKNLTVVIVERGALPPNKSVQKYFK